MSVVESNSHKLLVRTLTISLHYLGLFEDELELVKSRPSVLSPLGSPLSIRDEVSQILDEFSKISRQRELIKSAFWYDDQGFYLLNEALELVETWTNMLDDLISFAYSKPLVQGVLREGKKRNYGILINNFTALIDTNDSVKDMNAVYRSHDEIELDSEAILSYVESLDPTTTMSSELFGASPIAEPVKKSTGTVSALDRLAARVGNTALMSSEELERSLVQSISESLASSELHFEESSQSMAFSESLNLRETIDLSYTFIGVQSSENAHQAVEISSMIAAIEENQMLDDIDFTDNISRKDLVSKVKHCLFDMSKNTVLVIDSNESLKADLVGYFGFKGLTYLDESEGLISFDSYLSDQSLAYVFYPNQLAVLAGFQTQLKLLKQTAPQVIFHSF
ncbi:hypothetical protein [Streptococcus loxodontisalivarius]|uniref:Uncharacterized protein n=1 Tax=Streptococcus loxodontisalivarius TaxID=1349415 RepID=A0ABS2PP27_9STRE|nr:hypothetical protein [Streptococcus loxodontisalivarius]MBM7641778.1 hypothetical protein [Streptococcus loxodontisalivarius]